MVFVNCGRGEFSGLSAVRLSPIDSSVGVTTGLEVSGESCILAEGAIALSVTLSGGALFAS